jgi:hypothetical protein
MTHNYLIFISYYCLECSENDLFITENCSFLILDN